MEKDDLIDCVCKLEGADSSRREILATGYSEEQLKKLLSRMARQNMELTELQCVSMFS